MFTVVFADKENIKLFEETKMFFGPLYDSEQLSFCEWDADADSIDTMVPDLYTITEHYDEWRAIVFCDYDIEKPNPFDYTEYSESFYASQTKDWDFFKNRRKARLASYEKSVSNPIVKLTTALTEAPIFNSVLSNEEYSLLTSGKLQPYVYALKKQFEVLNCSEIAVRLDKYQREDLKKFVAEDKMEPLISCVRNADVSGIINLIPDTEISDFIKFLGNDPIYFDPEYTECLIENTKKNTLLNNLADNFAFKDKLPSEVICISPRTFDFEKIEQDLKWKCKDEISSSKFAEYNLYNEKLKFIVFDILPKDNKQYKFEQIKLMCLLLVVANNDLPYGYVHANNVYRADIDFDTEILTRICENYISKLKSTQILLNDIGIQLERDNDLTVDNATAKRLFESDIHIPVDINIETDENELYAEFDKIGLAGNCPMEESLYWSRQYRTITKKFVRYLREPRRSVKSAVFNGVKCNNTIDDDRTLFLSESQIEDVNFHIAEIEQKMVETTTANLYNTKKFNEQIEEADKIIKHGIAQRMTKRKTFFVGLVAVLTFFIGFLPLIFSNLNKMDSFLFSLSLTGITIGAFLVLGFICLFFLRNKLIKRFKHFNYVMSKIITQINGALSAFSVYLSSVCNLMRDFSVLKKRDSTFLRTKKILFYHDMQIEKQIQNVHDMFSKYVDFEKLRFEESKPYEFDFTVLKEYKYDMPIVHSPKKIEYAQPGNVLTVPVDYITAITLERVELYD